jgi:oligopeptide/dipeptide ABC transporter ATP-binding protein
VSTKPVLDVQDLRVRYGGGPWAVDGVSLVVGEAEIVGLVGESGSGKSTLAKAILGWQKPAAGHVLFEGRSIAERDRMDRRQAQSRLQLTPQHPETSLNPRLTVGQSIEFNLRGLERRRAVRLARVREVLEMVHLSVDYLDRYPSELSGGQAQRVAIARSLATRPSLIICDEAVSALDKSVQAQVLNLLMDLRAETGVAYLFLSHDLAVIEHIADRLLVMYRGRLIEQGSLAAVIDEPAHPYTRQLLASVPGRGFPASFGVLSAADEMSERGCSYRGRCPIAEDECSVHDPPLLALRPSSLGFAGQFVACHVAHEHRRLDAHRAFNPASLAVEQTADTNEAAAAKGL